MAHSPIEQARPAGRPENQCDRCDRFAMVTLTVADQAGERVVCSTCWKDLYAPDEDATVIAPARARGRRAI